MDGLGVSILEEGIEQGIERGIEQGKAKQIVASVASLMKTLGLPLERACRALDIELDDYEEAKKLIR